MKVTSMLRVVKKHFNYSFSQGFTLTELLITIAIIGVVAALVLPSLLVNLQEEKNLIGFKKNYSIISQAVNKIIADKESMQGQFSDNDSFMNLFKSYLTVVKSCNNGDSSCWTNNGARTDDYFLNGASVDSGWSWWYLNRPTAVLTDGTFINFVSISPACTGTDSGLKPEFAGTICGVLFVDVNGAKAPNTWGRDIFEIWVQKNKTFVAGPTSFDAASYASMGCDKFSGGSQGLLCAEYALTGVDY